MDDSPTYNFAQILRAITGLVFFIIGLLLIPLPLRLAFLLISVYILFTEFFTFSLIRSSADKPSIPEVLQRMYRRSASANQEREMAKFGLDIEKTTAQVLIAVGGIGVTLFSKEATAGDFIKAIAVLTVLFSVVLGLMYMFISQGSIVSDKDIKESAGAGEKSDVTKHILSVKAHHDRWKHWILDLQVLALIFGLSILGSPFAYEQPAKPAPVTEFIIKVRDISDLRIKEGDTLAVGSVVAEDQETKQIIDMLTSVIEGHQKLVLTLRKRKLAQTARELESENNLLKIIRETQRRQLYIVSPTGGKIKFIKPGALTATGKEIIVGVEATSH